MKTIVLTGATRGLGRAMAIEFARLGHVVLGCGRSRPGVEKLRSELGSHHDFDCVDVTRDSAVAAWAARLTASFGPPDLLLNNAGQINRTARLWEVPAGEFDVVLDVNVKGVANTIRHFAPSMVS